MIKLVLVRHGQSEWNLENRFTGWTDVNLSEKGVNEAIEAGRVLKQKGFKFDLAFTSVLKRAEDTLSYILKEKGLEISLQGFENINNLFEVLRGSTLFEPFDGKTITNPSSYETTS